MDNAVNKNYVLIIAAIASFLTPFMGSATNVALPSIEKEFTMDAVMLSWVATSFLLAAAMFLVPFGRIADIYGRKKVFTYGIFLYTISCLFSAISTSGGMLIASRAAQGIGSAMIFGTSMAILTSVYPPNERGKALGISVASVYLGLSLGPFLGGLLTQHLGWRSIFLFNLPLGLIIIAMVFSKLKSEWAEARGEKFDLAGSTIYSLTLVALMYGFSLLPKINGAWLIGAGVIGFLAFLRWETRIDSPVLNVKLFRGNKAFTLSNLAALINYSATFAVTFLLSLYLQYVKGLTPQNAGIVLVSQPVVMTIFSPLAGRLSDRVEPRIVASMGMGVTTLGLFLLTFISKNTAFGFIIAGLILLGFGFALFSSPNSNAVMSSVERKFYGVASGTLGTMRLTGQMLSMGIAMLLFAIFIGRVQITPAQYIPLLKSLKIAFAIFTAFCFAGVFASLARGNVKEAARDRQ
ncbi:MAG: MFS transporter [Actinomycetota bacterium]